MILTLQTKLITTQRWFACEHLIKIHYHFTTRHHTNMLGCLSIKCYTFTYCVHSLNTKTIHSNLNNLNIFTTETSPRKVKLILITKTIHSNLNNLNIFTNETSSHTHTHTQEFTEKFSWEFSMVSGASSLAV